MMKRLAKNIALKIPALRELYCQRNELEQQVLQLEESLSNACRQCEVCGSRIIRYNPLSDYFYIESKKYGYSKYEEICETHNRIDYACPHCSAADRDRLYALYLKEFFSQVKSLDEFILLQIAPSQAMELFLSSYYPEIKHITLDKYMENVDFHDDLTNIVSLGSNSIDFVICSHVLEHIEDDRKAMSEINRIMKPGAKGIIMVPLDVTIQETDEDANTSEAERWRRFAQGDHIRKYAKKDFVKRLEGSGLIVEQLGMEHFGLEAFWRNGITQSSVLYVVTKPNEKGSVES